MFLILFVLNDNMAILRDLNIINKNMNGFLYIIQNVQDRTLLI